MLIDDIYLILIILPYIKMLIPLRWQTSSIVNMETNSNIFEVEVKKIQFRDTKKMMNSDSTQRETVCYRNTSHAVP